MTAGKPTARFGSFGTCFGCPRSCNTSLVSPVSIEADVSQRVGELRCARCMHAKHIDPGRCGAYFLLDCQDSLVPDIRESLAFSKVPTALIGSWKSLLDRTCDLDNPFSLGLHHEAQAL